MYSMSWAKVLGGGEGEEYHIPPLLSFLPSSSTSPRWQRGNDKRNIARRIIRFLILSVSQRTRYRMIM